MYSVSRLNQIPRVLGKRSCLQAETPRKINVGCLSELAESVLRVQTRFRRPIISPELFFWKPSQTASRTRLSHAEPDHGPSESRAREIHAPIHASPARIGIWKGERSLITPRHSITCSTRRHMEHIGNCVLLHKHSARISVEMKILLPGFPGTGAYSAGRAHKPELHCES